MRERKDREGGGSGKAVANGEREMEDKNGLNSQAFL